MTPVRYSSSVIETPIADPAPPSPPEGPVDSPPAWYQDRRDRFRAEAAELATRAAHLPTVRLLLFLGLAVAAVWAYWVEGTLAAVLWIAAVVLTVAFVVQ